MNIFANAKRPLIMGILNVTPDSFSGDGLMAQGDYVSAALKLAAQMLEDGANILDVGGESSRPGAEVISIEEEIRRTQPVIAAIRKEFPSALLSIDTVKSAVATVALGAGATIINDISALAGDDQMATVAAKANAYIVLMHNRSRSSQIMKDEKIGGEYVAADYQNIVEDVKHDLLHSADLAMAAGVTDDKIILDAGIGFGKTVEQNLALINHTDELRKLGYPIMVGASRKSFIGRALELSVDERLEGTAATVAVASMKGADILRVHDVKFMARVARMAALIAQN